MPAFTMSPSAPEGIVVLANVLLVSRSRAVGSLRPAGNVIFATVIPAALCQQNADLDDTDMPGFRRLAVTILN